MQRDKEVFPRMLKYKRNMREQPDGRQSAVPREADRIYGSPEGNTQELQEKVG